jgi:hypothetical protein
VQLGVRVKACMQPAAMRSKEGILVHALWKALEEFIGFQGIAVDE